MAPKDQGSNKILLSSDGVNHKSSFNSLPAGISYICWFGTNLIKSFFKTQSPPVCKPTILE